MKRIIILLASLLFCQSGFSAELQSLVHLFNQRFALMKEVAADKATHHLPVEDLPQEQKVLDAGIQQAKQQGLQSDTVQPFIQAQMDASKAIQYRYRANWLSVPLSDPHPRDLTAVRAEIQQLSHAILQQITLVLHSPTGISANQWPSFKNHLKQENLSVADKKKLFNALLKIQLQQ